MARSSTTRRGNGVGKGEGWGGPPKGAGSKAEKAPAFKPGNAAAAGPHDMSRSERIAAHMARLERIAEAAEDAERYNEAISATNAVLDRLEGKPIARVSAEPGTTAGFVIYGEREKASTEEWAKSNPPPA